MSAPVAGGKGGKVDKGGAQGVGAQGGGGGGAKPLKKSLFLFLGDGMVTLFFGGKSEPIRPVHTGHLRRWTRWVSLEVIYCPLL